ncbi:hypothetical protein PP182_00915 [Maribacter sp. PR1]|uniref:Uncharacterized protein n=1 Tax=Maribacter cobaltidurans TaxID=1178778 RepID=A0ABU7INY2_9FLAO|nr:MULTISPECIES: hypothetical protein [Maribacter]MDC6387225.1 hypothetical protein [Maribacter sp. PR1]MEE1974610.1 hypothetical protein [Maribacter cobaltidurans]
MKTFQLLSVFFSLLFTSLTAFSQYGNVNGRQSNANFEANLAANNMMRSRDIFQEVLKKGMNNELKVEEIEGEPYFDEMFVNGELSFKDSLDLGQFLMRYNAYADEMEVSNPKGNNFINKVDGIAVILKNEKYVVLNYKSDDQTIKKGFFIEKSDGNKVNLYLRKYVTLKPAKEAKTSFHTATPASFNKHEAYFLKFGNDAPIEIKLKKSKILNSFPDKYDTLKKYVSTEKLNLEKEEDLIKLVQYYDSLN